MPFHTTTIKDLLIFEPKIFNDSRGYFFESYNKQLFINENLNYNFIQDNQSFSCYGVIRGLHFQKGEFAQTKLVRVLQGKIYDVAIDLRPDSKTFKHWFGLDLSSENKLQLLIPKGFAHGFSVLSETAEIQYKCDNFYNKAAEGGIIYNDEELNIDWKIPNNKALISEKDLLLNNLKNYV